MDPDGQFPETIWDIANASMDVYSFILNILEKNYGVATVDGIALTADVLAALIPFVPGGAGTIVRALRGGDHTLDAFKTVDAINAVDVVNDVTRSGVRPTLSSIKEAVIKAKERIGLGPTETLPKQHGKFGSPSRGDSRKGYRLDPPHSNNGAESKPHVNYWDYSNGKRSNGGVSGSIEIKD